MGELKSSGKSFEISKWEVHNAWQKVKANRGAAGVATGTRGGPRAHPGGHPLGGQHTPTQPPAVGVTGQHLGAQPFVAPHQPPRIGAEIPDGGAVRDFSGSGRPARPG